MRARYQDDEKVHRPIFNTVNELVSSSSIMLSTTRKAVVCRNEEKPECRHFHGACAGGVVAVVPLTIIESSNLEA